MKNRVAVIFALLTFLVTQASAQDRTKLDDLDEKVRRNFETTMPEWKHERVEPFGKSEDVLVEFWSFAQGQDLDFEPPISREGPRSFQKPRKIQPEP